MHKFPSKFPQSFRAFYEKNPVPARIFPIGFYSEKYTMNIYDVGVNDPHRLISNILQEGDVA